MKGRTFACLGNHDYEGLKWIKQALEEAEVMLLCDDAFVLDTESGPIQVIGTHYMFQRGKNGEHVKKVLARFPPPQSENQRVVRLLLVHDPIGFDFVPPDEGIIALAGHIHGGQVGLVSLGMKHTLGRLLGVPDHGLWGCGTNRLYVHRGNGQHSFPFRFGVAREKSLLLLKTD